MTDTSNQQNHMIESEESPDVSSAMDQSDMTLHSTVGEVGTSAAKSHCDSTTDLSLLADGLAVQYDEFVEALDELIDNAWSAAYGDQLSDVDPVNIEVSFLRDGDLVWVIIADDGPGIDQSTLANHYFRTGDKSESAGLLNQKGWGSGNALSWFEYTQSNRDEVFQLRTSAVSAGPTHEVMGPVTGDLPIRTTDTPWHDDTMLTAPTGTCLTVPCAWSEFKKAYGNGASRLSTIAEAIRLHLGIVYRDLITAHPDSQLTMRWGTIGADTHREEPVVPVYPQYTTTPETDVFTLSVAEGTYKVELEHGILNLEAMVTAIENEAPGLLSSTGTFPLHYRPNQRCQGIDILANGRELELSVFTDLWGVKRHNNYNRYSGRLKIVPQNGSPLPTDNKKTRLDRTSELWTELVDNLQQRTSPIKHTSQSDGPETETGEVDSSGDDNSTSTDRNAEETRSGDAQSDSPEITPDTNDSESDDDSGADDPQTNGTTLPAPAELGHHTLVEKLASKLRSESATKQVYTEKGYDGVHVDVVQVLTSDEVVLWEVKPVGCQPACKEVYHLLMYHDHYTRANGRSPQEIKLLSPALSGNGQSDLDELNGREAPVGGTYKLEHVDVHWLFESTATPTATTGAVNSVKGE